MEAQDFLDVMCQKRKEKKNQYQIVCIKLTAQRGSLTTTISKFSRQPRLIIYVVKCLCEILAFSLAVELRTLSTLGNLRDGNGYLGPRCPITTEELHMEI